MNDVYNKHYKALQEIANLDTLYPGVDDKSKPTDLERIGLKAIAFANKALKEK